jgi:ribonuclease HI
VAAERGAKSVVLRSDSRLLVEQLSGRFKVKNPALRQLHEEAAALLARFEKVAIEHVPRDFNVQADRLANEGIDAWLALERE